MYQAVGRTQQKPHADRKADRLDNCQKAIRSEIPESIEKSQPARKFDAGRSKEIIRWLRGLTTLSGNPSPLTSIHMMAHNYL